jgi:hypothetical protein
LVSPNEILFGQNDSNQQPILFWLNKFGQLAILPNGLKNYVFFCFLLTNFHKKIARFFYWVLAM